MLVAILTHVFILIVFAPSEREQERNKRKFCLYYTSRAQRYDSFML